MNFGSKIRRIGRYAGCNEIIAKVFETLDDKGKIEMLEDDLLDVFESNCNPLKGENKFTELNRWLEFHYYKGTFVYKKNSNETMLHTIKFKKPD